MGDLVFPRFPDTCDDMMCPVEGSCASRARLATPARWSVPGFTGLAGQVRALQAQPPVIRFTSPLHLLVGQRLSMIEPQPLVGEP